MTRVGILLIVLVCSACSTGAAVPALPDGLEGPVILAAPPVASPPIPSQVPTLPPRAVHETQWSSFAVVTGISLFHPAARVEMIGWHESTHDGARQMVPTRTAAAPFTMESRGRGTGTRSAADIVVAPDEEIRSPVTGTVLRAGTYVLYCEYSDDFAVIEPEGRPGWEVKILHIDGVRVAPGDQVEAGVTVLAGRATLLPFRSQVDDSSAAASWPHVHIEVIDTSIPDRPSGTGC